MKKYLIACLVFFIINNSFAQTKPEQIPLFKFFQENFDSTVVYHSFNSWVYEPHYSIICKTENKFVLFTYVNPYKGLSFQNLPKSLVDKYIHMIIYFRFTQPDTNNYFLPKPDFKNMNRIQLWDTITKNDIWNLKDDKDFGEGCNSKRCAVLDADEHKFFLITKSEIRELYYYAPSFYEGCCPENENRKKIIGIIQSFQKAFGENALVQSPASTISSQKN